MLHDIYIPESLDVQIIQHCDINTRLHNDWRILTNIPENKNKYTQSMTVRGRNAVKTGFRVKISYDNILSILLAIRSIRRYYIEKLRSWWNQFHVACRFT